MLTLKHVSPLINEEGKEEKKIMNFMRDDTAQDVYISVETSE